jgi:hypothetical protein
MQIENRNTYNTLGRIGPLHPRPEYRPPQKGVEEDQAGGSQVKGDAKESPSESLILSENLRSKSTNTKTETQGRLNVLGAQSLVEKLKEDITELSPNSTNGCPHRKVDGDALMYPIYA